AEPEAIEQVDDAPEAFAATPDDESEAADEAGNAEPETEAVPADDAITGLFASLRGPAPLATPAEEAGPVSVAPTNDEEEGGSAPAA
ncbi:MAG: hypothetical protein GWN83_15110, partial [Gemmatimonadetes bacterium]|nr:hypothetical protein [Gemmatimonadota bacterium]